MSPREIIAYLKGSAVHVIILVIGVVTAYVVVGKFKSGELSFGGGSLQQKISNQEKDLEELKKRLQVGKERLAKREALDEKAEELAVMQAELKQLQEANAVAAGKLSSLEKGLIETEEMYEAYRKRYRSHVREKAVGTKMEKITTLGGKTYEQVTIKSVGALGLNITHKDGSRRIPFNDLPKDLQKRYQFDEEEAEAQLKREAEIRRRHRMAQAAAQAAAEERANNQPKVEDPDKPKLSEEERKRKIATLNVAIEQIKQKMRRAESNLRLEREKTVSRAPQYRAELKQLRAALDANQAILRQLQSMR